MTEIQEKVGDYFRMGVKAVWVVDLRRQVSYSASEGGSLQAESAALVVKGTSVRVPVEEIFRELIRLQERAERGDATS